MQIIGAGFGRTGTMSLAAALEQLGFGPCYHMLDVFKHPSHIGVWQAAADGQKTDWKQFLGGYKAGLDYPLVAFYKDLMEVFPEAKVILTLRDPELWYESTRETIYRGSALPDWLMRILPPFRGMKQMVRSTTWDRLFQGRFEDRRHAIRVFRDHIEEVKRTVPKEKLLIYSVSESWEPLCAFLDVPVPKRTFPHINDRKTTQRMYLLARVLAALLFIGGVGTLIWLVSQVV